MVIRFYFAVADDLESFEEYPVVLLDNLSGDETLIRRVKVFQNKTFVLFQILHNNIQSNVSLPVVETVLHIFDHYQKFDPSFEDLFDFLLSNNMYLNTFLSALIMFFEDIEDDICYQNKCQIAIILNMIIALEVRIDKISDLEVYKATFCSIVNIDQFKRICDVYTLLLSRNHRAYPFCKILEKALAYLVKYHVEQILDDGKVPQDGKFSISFLTCILSHLSEIEHRKEFTEFLLASPLFSKILKFIKGYNIDKMGITDGPFIGDIVSILKTCFRGDKTAMRSVVSIIPHLYRISISKLCVHASVQADDCLVELSKGSKTLADKIQQSKSKELSRKLEKAQSRRKLAIDSLKIS
ncbi:hypothetical protein GJ496_002308, partial [Pomphorhynchus laevis]